MDATRHDRVTAQVESGKSQIETNWAAVMGDQDRLLRGVTDKSGSGTRKIRLSRHQMFERLCLHGRSGHELDSLEESQHLLKSPEKNTLEELHGVHEEENLSAVVHSVHPGCA